MSFILNPLPYAYDALEPFIDTLTMQIHHDKHHATYVTNLNAAIEKHSELTKRSIESLLSDLNSVPEDIRLAVRNHGGGTWNHDQFWQVMAPKAGGEPEGDLAKKLNVSFGTFANFKAEFEKIALGRFGSGWAWLVKKADGTLEITQESNAGNPLRSGLTPLLTCDVWEHAYYLDKQNLRPNYIADFWNLVDWDAVTARL